MQGSANLNIMIKAVRAAARSLVRDFAEIENLQASVKGPLDFADKAEATATDTIRDMLMRERPNYGWLASRGEEITGKDPTRRWIVTAVDGGVNYRHGLPHWAVSVALEHKGDVVAGVIFDPAKDEMFWAEKGAGAFMNDRRMRVSGRGRLIESVFATGLPAGGRSDLPLTLKDLGRLLPASGGVRTLGAASLDLAYVAGGRYDGFWERRVNPWAVAAGLVIVREAGGLVEPLAGDSVLDSATVIATNGSVFEELAKVLRQQ